MDLRTANVTRYILPLREGGSLPALAEADDEFKYVVKFRGGRTRNKSADCRTDWWGDSPCTRFQSPRNSFSESGRGLRTNGSRRRDTGFTSMESRTEYGIAFPFRFVDF